MKNQYTVEKNDKKNSYLIRYSNQYGISFITSAEYILHDNKIAIHPQLMKFINNNRQHIMIRTMLFNKKEDADVFVEFLNALEVSKKLINKI